MVDLEEVGPIEARKLGDLPLAGPGEGVGLGGWRDAIVVKNYKIGIKQKTRRRVGSGWLDSSGTSFWVRRLGLDETSGACRSSE